MARKVIIRGKGRRKLLKDVKNGQKFMFSNGRSMYRMVDGAGAWGIKHLSTGKMFYPAQKYLNAKVMIYNG